MEGRTKQSDGPMDVVGMGQYSLDYLGIIAAYPEVDTKCEFRDLTVQCGGPAATALVALSRWGFRCSFYGVAGDDDFGARIRESLNGEGVGTDGLIARKEGRSQFAFIAVEPENGGRRTIFWQRPTGAPLRPDEVDMQAVRSARVFLTDGLMIEASLAAAKAAKDAGVPVVVDGGTLREGMLDLARLSDCYIVSEPFAKALVPGGSPEEACRQLAALGPRIVGVTLGPAGSIALTAAGWVRQAAYPVAAIDTTGCGDIFHAGFVYGLLTGWDVSGCLDFGAWAAARVSLQLGGRTGIPTRREMAAAGFDPGISGF